MKGISLFTNESRLVVVPTRPPIQWVSGALSLDVKRPGREGVHLVPRLRMCGAILPLPHTFQWRGGYLCTGTTVPYLTPYSIYAAKTEGVSIPLS